MNEELILSKLGIGKRSASFILANEYLCKRIETESVMPLADFVKKYCTSLGFIKSLIDRHLVTCFSNRITKGSKKFIFEEEAKSTVINSMTSYGYTTRINDVVKLYLKIIEPTITEKEFKIIYAFLVDKKSVLEISSEMDLTITYVNQIYQKAHRRVMRPARLYFYSNIKKEYENIVFEVEELKKQKESYIKYLSSRGVLKKEFINPKLNIQLIDCDLSVRVLNCCKSADIETINDLIQYSKLDMVKFRNFGKRSLDELEYFLESMNLSFKPNH